MKSVPGIVSADLKPEIIGPVRAQYRGFLVYLADMENVRNFTLAGLFVSRFYPRVRELCQF